MERNNITPGPECPDARTLYEVWLRTHVGSYEDFFLFMTTPTAEREVFMARCNAVTERSGALFRTYIR